MYNFQFSIKLFIIIKIKLIVNNSTYCNIQQTLNYYNRINKMVLRQLLVHVINNKRRTFSTYTLFLYHIHISF